MRSLVLAAVLVASLGTALFAKERTKPSTVGQTNNESRKSLDPGVDRSPSELDKGAERTVVLNSKSNEYGTYNVATGTRGPFFSAQNIWNASTRKYNLTIAAGSTTISGFSDTTGLLPGMIVEITPDTLPANTNIVSVGANSIVVSNAPTRDGTGEAGTFGLVNNGLIFNQVITNYPLTFPRRTTIEWSYPSEPNDVGVYSYGVIAGYGIGSGGYWRPVKRPAPKKVSEFSDLAVTYDVSVAGDPNDFDFLIETYPTTASDPSPPNVTNTMTNEIGFVPHVPRYLWTWILGLKDHFDYSSSDGTFHAYVATRPGNAFTQSPPYTLIVPVTEAHGRTPRDMMSGTQTLPVLGVLRELVTRGIIPTDSYICGFDFGFEIGRNAGRATLNDIAWKWE